MFLFHTPKPRKFHHEFIYVNEHKELISNLKAKYAKGVEAPDSSQKYHEEMAERVRKSMMRHSMKAGNRLSARNFPFAMMAFVLVLLFVIVWFCFR